MDMRKTLTTTLAAIMMMSTGAGIVNEAFPYAVEENSIVSEAASIKAPTNLKVTKQGYASLSLSWNKSSGAVRYKVEYYPAGKKEHKSVIAKSNSITLTNLTPGIYYYVDVYSVDSSGMSSNACASIKKNTKVVPVPQAFKTHANSTSISVSCQSVSGATGYQYILKYNNKSIERKLSKSTSYTFKNLLPGTKYDVYVKSYVMENGKEVFSNWKHVKDKTTYLDVNISKTSTPGTYKFTVSPETKYIRVYFDQNGKRVYFRRPNGQNVEYFDFSVSQKTTIKDLNCFYHPMKSGKYTITAVPSHDGKTWQYKYGSQSLTFTK